MLTGAESEEVSVYVKNYRIEYSQLYMINNQKYFNVGCKIYIYFYKYLLFA